MGPLVIIIFLFGLSYGPLQWSATPALRRHIGPAFVISYLGPLVLGLLLPKAPVFLGIVFIFFMATTRDRLDAGCRFILLALLLPQIIWRISVGSFYLLDITTIDVLAIAALIQSAIKPGPRVAPMPQWTAEDWFVILTFVILWIGGGRMPSATIFMRESLSQLLLVVIPYVTLRRTLRSSDEFMRAIACLAVGCGILALFALYEALNGWTLFGTYRHVSDAAGMNKGLIQRGGALRAPATMSSALMLGVVLLAGLTAALYSRRFVRQGWMLAGWVAMIFLGLMMTQSRGNTALLPVAVLIFCLIRRKYGYAALIGIGAPAAFGILMAAAHVSPQIAAFLNVGGQGSSSQLTADVYDYRELLFSRGMEEAAKHRWTGASYDYVVSQLADISQGQGIVDMVNTYLTFYLISGLVGMLPFFALFGVIWWKLLSARTDRGSSPELIDMRGFALAALAVVTVQLAFMSYMDRLPLIFALALIGARMVTIELRRRKRTTKPGTPGGEALAVTRAHPSRAVRRPGTPAPSQG